MREKRQRRPRNPPAEMLSLVMEPKKRRIKKQESHSRSDQSLVSPDHVYECVSVPPTPAVGKKDKTKKPQSKKKVEEPMELDMDNEAQESADVERESEDAGQSEPKLSNLAKLSENYKEIKAAYEENLSQYKYHQKECQKLSQKVNQTNGSIQSKAKELKSLSRKIYIEALQTNKEQFLNSKTFTEPTQFKSFIKSMKKLVEAIKNCPYEDPLHNLKLTKITLDKLLGEKRVSHVRQHKRDMAIKSYITDFPYLALAQQFLPLVQALMGSTRYTENSSLESIQQFPCLFMRESSLPYSLLEKSLQLLYKICSQEQHRLATQINSLIQQNPEISDTTPEIIQELLYKALAKIKFICLPEQHYQLRSFCFGEHIYINTYYPEKQVLGLAVSAKAKEICVVYCVFNGMRMLPDYVQNALVYALDRDSEDIGRLLAQIKDRTDLGAKLEQVIRRGQGGFVCCSYEDYRNLDTEVPRLWELGRYNDGNDCFVYEEQRKRRQKITSQIVDKYKEFKVDVKSDTRLGRTIRNDPDINNHNQDAHNSDSDLPRRSPRNRNQEIQFVDFDQPHPISEERKSEGQGSGPLAELDSNRRSRLR